MRAPPFLYFKSFFCKTQYKYSEISGKTHVKNSPISDKTQVQTSGGAATVPAFLLTKTPWGYMMSIPPRGNSAVEDCAGESTKERIIESIKERGTTHER